MQKSFIWFDLGYTLVYQNRESAYRTLLLEQGIDHIPLEEIEKAYHMTDKLFMRQYPGALGKELYSFYPWYIGTLNYSLNVSFDLRKQCERLLQLQGEQQPMWRSFPFAAEVLGKLKRHNFGVGLISNWNKSCRDVLADNGLASYFDEIVVSAEVGLEKPDKRIFIKAMSEAGVKPEQCVYVGDNYYDDVIGSAGAGIDCYLINRFGRLGIEELQYDRLIVSIEELPELLLKPEQMIS
ncbi:HAD family hydrolase [Paenibacillus sp. NEAU-GSW1]|uniref:HAD family hydrolase n=1 Tax=Paenibacillus sp. NEAU-GSW1 TaxID=2682486 RepID=UPI0012E1A7EE|nr:HAD-IA family hydrolase [Paenibacillus sp. NEAU-GSW1]MUT67619.1 HAD-IA family hydrolase [Paenibacillus sp. NEAU-GSW1]